MSNLILLDRLFSIFSGVTVKTENVTANSTGTIPKGALVGSCFNSGGANGLWNGEVIPAGVSIPIPYVGINNSYDEIEYDATGTTFVIQYTIKA